MNEMRHNANYRTKRQQAVRSRAFCGLTLLTGGFGELVVSRLRIRPKGVLS